MKAVSKFAARGLMLGLLAAGIGAVAFKQNAVARLRSEQQVLLGESQEAQQLAAENDGIGKLREENAEVIKLREENKDLPRLRNEVRQLRKQLSEMQELSTENQRLSAQAMNAPVEMAHQAVGADFVPRSL